MSFMAWSDEYCLCMEKVDDQHRHLFELVNKLHDSVINALEQNAMGEILDELIDYTVYHFETEEEMFRKHNYPKLESHKEEHDKLIKEVLELQEKFYKHEVTITYDVLNFLCSWVKDHTTETDMEYVEFLKGKL